MSLSAGNSSDWRWPRLFLASASPRRRDLLMQLGVEFDVLEVDVDETWDGIEAAQDYVQRLALTKAEAGLARVHGSSQRLVLGADTAVAVNGQVLGKALQPADARAMLSTLSGRTHDVYSAVALKGHGRPGAVAVSVTKVSMSLLSDRDIGAYCATLEPLGKAGGYAIQGLAASFIERIEGSYSGVVGLPLFETASLLRTYGNVEMAGAINLD